MRTSPYRSPGTVHDGCWQADAAATTKKHSKCLLHIIVMRELFLNLLMVNGPTDGWPAVILFFPCNTIHIKNSTIIVTVLDRS